MATEDDDFLAGPVPAPDAEASAAERAHAKTFAELVDKTLAGRTPPAMSADDRALLEVATVIRAASGNATLAPSATRGIVEDALKQAIGGAGCRPLITPSGCWAASAILPRATSSRKSMQTQALSSRETPSAMTSPRGWRLLMSAGGPER